MVNIKNNGRHQAMPIYWLIINILPFAIFFICTFERAKVPKPVEITNGLLVFKGVREGCAVLRPSHKSTPATKFPSNSPR